MLVNQTIITPIGDLTIKSIQNTISISFKDCKANGIQHTASLTAAKDDLENWIISQSDFYISRKDGFKEATDSAIDKIISNAQTAITTWTKNNPNIILKAARCNAYTELLEMSKRINTLEIELESLKTVFHDKNKKYKELKTNEY